MSFTPGSLLVISFVVSPVLAFADIWTVAQDGDADFTGRDEKPIVAAIEEAKRAGGGDIVVGPGVYRINRSIRLEGVENILIRGEGKVVLQLAPTLVTELSEPAQAGERELHLKSPEGVQPGLELRILAPGEVVPLTGRPKPSFEAVVESVKGSIVTLEDPLPFPAPEDTRVVDENGPNLITIYGACADIGLENLILDGALRPDGIRQSTHHTRCGLWIQGPYDYLTGSTGPKPRRVTVRNCRIRNCHGRGIAIYSASECRIEACVVENVLDEGINLDHFVERCHVVDNIVRGANVGIEMNDANDCVAELNLIEDCPVGIRLWRYCKIEELNVRNLVRANRLRGIRSIALEFQTGTSDNLGLSNVLELPAGASDTRESPFRDAGTDNRLEGNRIEPSH